MFDLDDDTAGSDKREDRFDFGVDKGCEESDECEEDWFDVEAGGTDSDEGIVEFEFEVGRRLVGDCGRFGVNCRSILFTTSVEEDPEVDCAIKSVAQFGSSFRERGQETTSCFVSSSL